jgi:hypothetical protein
MSRQNIEAALNQYASGNATLDQKLRKKVSTRAYTHELTITTKGLKESYVRALKLVRDDAYQNAIYKANKPAIWVKAINKVMMKVAAGTAISSLKVGGNFYYSRTLAKGSVKITRARPGIYKLFMFSSAGKPNQTQLSDILKHIKDAIYEEWRATNNIGELLKAEQRQTPIFERAFRQDPEYGRAQSAQKKYRDELKFSHAKESTVAVATIDRVLNEELKHPRYTQSIIPILSRDLIAELWEYLDIEWEEETIIKPNGSIETKRIIRGGLLDDKIKHGTDKGEIEWGELIEIINEFFRKKSPFLRPEEAANFEASPSFRQQAAQAAQYALLRDLMQKNKKHVASKSIKTKKLNSKRRKGKVKTQRTSSKKLSSLALAARTRRPISKGKETGQGQETPTSTAADLARIKTYINSRLGAEVRRNMGRPALINRTGIFSNSARLMSLRPAANTIVAKYTYMLTGGGTSKNRQGVYETFENTGSRRWPMGYNPKPLIAKSIRNLAKGRIEQKLTLRRV